MRWNWQSPGWPRFTYRPETLVSKEKEFLLDVGSSLVYFKSIGKQEYNQFVVEILSSEGLESSKIEGELLDRESLQSSIKQHFGLKTPRKPSRKESGMADILCSVYETFDQPLTHEMLWHWHSTLFADSSHIEDRGKYRTHPEPMQIISHRYDSPKVFFEAPPSERVHGEMQTFIDWFNSSRSEPILGRASIAHVYFESIHPFEDGNGRIGRLLVEKVLSQGVDRPTLIAVSRILERKRKAYYSALERCNNTLEVGHWVDFFSGIILEAQKESTAMFKFLMGKTKLFASLSGQINERQEKALLRVFSEGLEGFKGGLSADNYIAITKTSRATATRDLADLVQKHALRKTGELRHTRYWLNSDLFL